MWKNETRIRRKIFQHYAKEKKKENDFPISIDTLNFTENQTNKLKDPLLVKYSINSNETSDAIISSQYPNSEEMNNLLLYSEPYNHTSPVVTPNNQESKPIIPNDKIPYIITQPIAFNNTHQYPNQLPVSIEQAQVQLPIHFVQNFSQSHIQFYMQPSYQFPETHEQYLNDSIYFPLDYQS
ncbi:1195_t:CDS:1 [Acaulospora morrowiae]|uniref:1195_t:CDS:1 n=1 Tax=Acaulospora morrowiae TaxID=94023 RepID=A0A9N9E0A3_9GLOM|nr:1195_t:CDS:1 [Acaulospora morrowiae]